MPKRISSLAERYHIEDISPVPQGTDIIEKSHLCQQTKVTFFVAQKEGFEVASQPLLRCPKKSFGRYPRFSSIFSTAAPTPTRFIAFGALAGVAHAGPGAQVQIPFFLIKNQKQPPCWTTAFCLGAEGGI